MKCPHCGHEIMMIPTNQNVIIDTGTGTAINTYPQTTVITY